MLFGMILRYFGLILGGIKAIVAESREFLSMAMIEFLGEAEWSMLPSDFDGRI
jgi:hypothetical protein